MQHLPGIWQNPQFLVHKQCFKMIGGQSSRPCPDHLVHQGGESKVEERGKEKKCVAGFA